MHFSINLVTNLKKYREKIKMVSCSVYTFLQHFHNKFNINQAEKNFLLIYIFVKLVIDVIEKGIHKVFVPCSMYINGNDFCQYEQYDFGYFRAINLSITLRI